MPRLEPINVAFVVFAENVRTVEELDQQLEQLSRLKAIADSFSSKLTVLVSGPFADRAVSEGQQSVFTDLISAGHEVGTYVIPFCRISSNVWTDVRSQIPNFPSATPRNDGLLSRAWTENTAAVNSLIGSVNNKTVHSTHFLLQLEETLLTVNGFSTSFATRKNKGLEYIGHPVEHPFRPTIVTTAGLELKENTGNQFVFVDGFTEVSDYNDPFSCPDLRANAIARSFEDSYKRWIGTVDNRVWSFAFSASLNAVTTTDEIKQVLNTISGYIGRVTSPANELIAQFSTIQGITNRFYNWQAANPPGTSSFSFVRTVIGADLPAVNLQTEISQIFIPSNNRRLFAHLHKPVKAVRDNKLPGVVIISGDGAITKGLSPHEIASLGFVVVHYDRAGKGHSTGSNDLCGANDQLDLKQVVAFLRSKNYVDASNVGVISFSSGNIVVAGAISSGLDIKYFVDWEGPSNRDNILKNDKSEDWSQFDRSDNSFWNPREPYRNIRAFHGRYLRAQGAIDHFQGTDMGHAIEMVNNATSSALGGFGHSAVTVLNGNTVNQTYDESQDDSIFEPHLWLQGQSIVQIAEDHAGNILKYFKFIANYSRLNTTVVVTIPKVDRFEQDEAYFSATATRLRRLASVFEAAKAKLSFLTENPFIDGSRRFNDNVLSELVQRGHSVGNLINIPAGNIDEESKQRYIVDSRTNLNSMIGSINNLSVMGALTLEDPNFLYSIGYRGVLGPLLSVPHEIPRAAIVRRMGHDLLRTADRFLTADDPFGKLFYLPGDLSKISKPNGISTENTRRAINSIVVSRNLVNPNRANSWYMFLDINDFTAQENQEMAVLQQWATQEMGHLVNLGEVEWASLGQIIDEAQAIIDRDELRRPAAPTGLTADALDHAVSLTWNPVPEAAGYLVLKAGNCFGKNFVPLQTIGARDPKFCDGSDGLIHFTDGKVNNNEEYCYLVQAFTSDIPPIFSDVSNEVCATPEDSQPPPSPCIVDILAGNRSVAITWEHQFTPDTKGFRVYRQLVDQSERTDFGSITDVCDLRENFQLVAELKNPKENRYIDFGVENNQEYAYLVSAIDYNGNESFDNTCFRSGIPFDTVASIPLWIATDLGVSRTNDKGAHFDTMNPCGPVFDNAASDVRFVTPTNNSTISLPAGVFLAVDDIKGVQKVQVGINSDRDLITLEKPVGSNLYQGVIDRDFADGTTLALFAFVTNSVGVVTREAITVTIRDVEGPQITVISPQNGDTVSTSVTVKIEAIDPSGVDQVSVSIANGNFQRAKKIDNFWFITFDTRQLNGSVDIVAKATDLTGRESTAAPISIVVNNLSDTRGPATNVLAPINGGEVSGVITVSAEAQDPSGVRSLEVSFNGGPWFPMSFSSLQSNNLLLANALYPNWSPDGTKITFINSVDGKLYEVDVDENGQAGASRIVHQLASVPGIEISNALSNPSFETIDNFGAPNIWEIGRDAESPFIVFDSGSQVEIGNLYIGPGRTLATTVPFQVFLNPGSSLTEGPPVPMPVAGEEFGIFIWHEPGIGTDIWHVLAVGDGTERRIKGAIITNQDIVNFNPFGISLSDVTNSVREIVFELEATSALEEFSFETPGPLIAVPFKAEIDTQASDGVNAIKLVN